MKTRKELREELLGFQQWEASRSGIWVDVDVLERVLLENAPGYWEDEPGWDANGAPVPDKPDPRELEVV